MTVPAPGELYWAYLESGQRRPVVVVSRAELNRGDYVVAVPLTSSRLDTRWSLPSTVAFRSGDFGLPKDCVAQYEAITLVEKTVLDMDGGPFARLSPDVWRDMVCAIGHVICADCEPA